MKYPLAILVATVFLPTFMIVRLTSFLLTEFVFLQSRNKQSD